MVNRVNVQVIAHFGKSGKVTPLRFRWTDDEWYKIDRILGCCRAASLKAGGCGLRYEIRVGREQSYLFYDSEDDVWFMEKDKDNPE